MTVRELIEELLRRDPDDEVYADGDADGLGPSWAISGVTSMDGKVFLG